MHNRLTAWATVFDFKFQISNFKFQISNFKSQISNLKSQISNLKSQIEQSRPAGHAVKRANRVQYNALASGFLTNRLPPDVNCDSFKVAATLRVPSLVFNEHRGTRIKIPLGGKQKRDEGSKCRSDFDLDWTS